MKRRNWHSLFSQLPDTELEKLAVLRLLECSNGVIQHQFRDGHDDALSPEETRAAMAFSMSATLRQRVKPPSDARSSRCARAAMRSVKPRASGWDISA